jgi:hypothetical protein
MGLMMDRGPGIGCGDFFKDDGWRPPRDLAEGMGAPEHRKGGGGSIGSSFLPRASPAPGYLSEPGGVADLHTTTHNTERPHLIVVVVVVVVVVYAYVDSQTLSHIARIYPSLIFSRNGRPPALRADM